MISFRTELTVIPQTPKLWLQATVLTAGSCFAEVMGNKLVNYKVKTLVNPFGTIFNPVALFNLLEAALTPEIPFTGELVERDGIWYAYDLHSSFKAKTKDELLQHIQEALHQTHTFLTKADTIILTFGTAVGYIHQQKNILVANCHKILQSQFRKTVLSSAEITTAFTQFYNQLKRLNSKARIILTVSPVRHLKETLELNSVSKSVLRVATHEIISTFSDTSYFPAYEIVLDDLRDYRFYKPDMLHPSEEAENYIWDKFKHAYSDENFQSFALEWDKIQQAINHRPFNPEAPAHQLFLKKTLARLTELNQLVNCEKEIELIKMQLS